ERQPGTLDRAWETCNLRAGAQRPEDLRAAVGRRADDGLHRRRRPRRQPGQVRPEAGGGVRRERAVPEVVEALRRGDRCGAEALSAYRIAVITRPLAAEPRLDLPSPGEVKTDAAARRAGYPSTRFGISAGRAAATAGPSPRSTRPALPRLR